MQSLHLSLPRPACAAAQAAFVTKLKSDFEALSLAIANLPVGLIPFPEVAKAALQQLNADVVHGVTSGALDINAISADREAVANALGGLGSEGAPSLHALAPTGFNSCSEGTC
jgi:hypothetical protein